MEAGKVFHYGQVDIYFHYKVLSWCSILCKITHNTTTVTAGLARQHHGFSVIKDQLQRSKKIRNLAVVCWIISYYRHLYHENLDSSLYLFKKIHFRNPFLPRYIARFAKGACRHRLINISWIQLFPPLDDVRPGKRYTSWFTCYTSNA